MAKDQFGARIPPKSNLPEVHWYPKARGKAAAEASAAYRAAGASGALIHIHRGFSDKPKVGDKVRAYGKTVKIGQAAAANPSKYGLTSGSLIFRTIGGRVVPIRVK